MRVLLLLLVFVAVASATVIGDVSVKHFEALTNVRVQEVGEKTIGKLLGFEQLKADRIHLAFDAFGQSFSFENLQIATNIFAPRVQFEVIDGQTGQKTLYSPVLRSYLGGFGLRSHAAVTFFDDGTFAATILDRDHNELYHIDPVSRHAHVIQTSPTSTTPFVVPASLLGKFQEAGVKMVAHRESDVVATRKQQGGNVMQEVVESVAHVNGGMVMETVTNVVSKRLFPETHQLDHTEYWSDCYPGQSRTTKRTMNIGLAVDSSFYTIAGNTDSALDAVLQQVIMVTNVMYEHQFDTNVVVTANPVVYKTSGGETWNACGVDTSTKLDNYRTWRANNKPEASWHLMTNCFPPPGTVGLAYVGVMCNMAYSAGWSNYLASSRTWSVFAHEMGHNFGAGHSFENGQGSTGGIMDYGNGLYNNIYQFHPLKKKEVCPVLTSGTSSSNKNCMAISSQAQIPDQLPCNGGPSCAKGPGGSPSPSPAASYEWYSSAFGACSVTCTSATSVGIQVRTVYCAIKGTTSRVADSNCDATIKPANSRSPCVPAPNNCPTPSVCGNGAVEAGEQCDAPGNPCCIKCQLSNTTVCQLADSTPDDAFYYPDTGKLYFLKGSQYVRMTPNAGATTILDATPDAGFPIVISGPFRGLAPAFLTNVDAASFMPDGHIAFFKGTDMVLYHHGMGMHRGMPVPLNNNIYMPGIGALDSYWHSNLDAVTDAYGSSVFLFKGRFFVEYDFASTIITRRVVRNGTLADFNLAWPQINAAVSDRKRYIDFFYNGQVARFDWITSSILPGYPRAGRSLSVAADPNAAACLVPDCARCSTDLKICSACASGFKPTLGGRMCVSNARAVTLKFDPNLDSKEADLYYMAPIPTANSVPGMLSDANALRLDSFQLKLKPAAGSFAHFSLIFWIQPSISTLPVQTLFNSTVVTNNALYPSSRIEVTLIRNTNTSLAAPRYFVQLNMLGQILISGVSMATGGWQHVVVSYIRGVLSVEIEGERASIPFQVNTQVSSYLPSVSFTSMYVDINS
eukprot:TRINITY_DN531_c0_g1_i5.p1 TRINITY_DN531_c0_g1~~TRINITY_DN531_c0_g1_i5.p1  ORF type:complete len:1022 (-),score=341.48 TRINITY_DN531_c0_g1_i5:177-3242(-)